MATPASANGSSASTSAPVLARACVDHAGGEKVRPQQWWPPPLSSECTV